VKGMNDPSWRLSDSLSIPLLSHVLYKALNCILQTAIVRFLGICNCVVVGVVTALAIFVHNFDA